MNTEIFRKVSLARLSSPEQLDLLLRVNTPKSWIALLALLILLGVAVAWGYEGVIATKAAGQGVVIRTGGVLNVASLGGGQVLQLSKNVGDKVAVGEVIGMVAQPSLIEKIRMARAQVEDAKNSREQMRVVRADGVKLELESIAKQRANLEQEIQALQAQMKIVAEQIPVDEELYKKGLITKQQTFASKNRVIDLQAQIDRQRASLVQLNSTEFQTQHHNTEADTQSGTRIVDLQRNVQALEKELASTSRVISPYSGEVIEVKVAVGSLVSVGTPILSVQPDVPDLEVIAYIPSEKAKEIRPGMKAEVSPSTVKREEFGFIQGTVLQVANFPATEAALMRIFENGPLAKSLASGGPVTELKIRMEGDPKTPSGFKWSSPLGAPLKISGGTICNVQIVTREQPPVTLVFPYIKEKLGVS